MGLASVLARSAALPFPLAGAGAGGVSSFDSDCPRASDVRRRTEPNTNRLSFDFMLFAIDCRSNSRFSRRARDTPVTRPAPAWNAKKRAEDSAMSAGMGPDSRIITSMRGSFQVNWDGFNHFKL